MEITQAQIKSWKKKWGEVFQIDVPTDDEGNIAIGYFKKPNLETISAAEQFVESEPIKAGNIMFNNCWLGGDDQVKENDECRISAIKVIGSLFKVRTATLKKL